MKYYYLFFFFVIFSSCSDEKKHDLNINKINLSNHPYWGRMHLSDVTRFDTIKIPLEIDTYMFIDDISELETNKSDFNADIKLRLWSSFDEDEILKGNDTIKNDTINLSADYLIEFDYKITENLYHSKWQWDGYYEDVKKYRYVKEMENKFHHKWDLRKYPFDKQKIRFSFTSLYDTSYVRIKNSKKFISSANEYLPNLKDGFVIDTILFKEEFIKSEIIEPFDDGIYDYQGGTERNEVRSRGVYEVVLSRQGSWLFFKLFLGSFLSLILSWFVFLIPMSEFDAKSNLSVGAIFGAVGNKYFVDSAISSQVLTTADLINNLIIAVVIFNVLIMIYQKNNKLKSKFLKHENSALKFSIGTFIICLACLLIFIA
jgi:hypothetical protein|tara:strand:- start:3 stop:1118 length:1116 start_codon:yes stop_codon:yes gene_type:complete